MRSEFVTQKNDKYMFPNSILGTAPKFAWLNFSGFLSVGRPKALLYPVVIENEENLHQRLLRYDRPFATAPGTMKLCVSPRSDVSMCALIGEEDILSIPCELQLGKQ